VILTRKIKTYINNSIDRAIAHHKDECGHERKESHYWFNPNPKPTVESLKSDLAAANARIDLLMKHFDLAPQTDPQKTYLVKSKKTTVYPGP
jgi:hypothetical protein